MTYVFPLDIAEESARKYLAIAQQKDIHDRVQAAEAIGYLTSTMQRLLDSLEAERAKPKRSLQVDPLLRDFVGDLADRLRTEGMHAAADRIVELTDQTLRIGAEYVAAQAAAKAVAA
ncbi:hypothetical protein [Streptomyces sp. NPDC060027]|uniref:hypothetical protein n=1 Tax=Streptomyces sp. NPDC060027 TaxID=3347040 RepID=UPI0036A954ED